MNGEPTGESCRPSSGGEDEESECHFERNHSKTKQLRLKMPEKWRTSYYIGGWTRGETDDDGWRLEVGGGGGTLTVWRLLLAARCRKNRR